MVSTRGDNDTEANRQVLKLVKQTCAHIMKSSKVFREGFVEQMNRFMDHPAGRTIDAVPDLRVLLAQVISYGELTDEEREIPNENPQAMDEDKKVVDMNDMEFFARVWVEEALRRRLKKDLTFDMLKALVPNHLDVCRNLKDVLVKDIEKKLASGQKTDQWAKYRVIADQLR